MKNLLKKNFLKLSFTTSWFFLSLFCSSCSGSLKQSEYQKIRHANQITEKIFRKHCDMLLNHKAAQQQNPEPYPWQHKKSTEELPLITKEFFRCRGDASHPSYTLSNQERLFDCLGSLRHSLPIKEAQEHVYPILIDLLNDLQVTLKKKVVITCGHRCPQHNRYSDPSEVNQTSKHMVGAEVDFYVSGFEKKPELIVDLLMQYFQRDPETCEDPDAITFKRYTKPDSYVSTPPWYNSEVYIKIYRENEGRDLDNQHPYPYISIQVRKDRQSNQRVTYTWEQAFYSYLRY